VGFSGGPAGSGWMLSVRRRQEDARALGQLRAMDDDAELEEGEAAVGFSGGLAGSGWMLSVRRRQEDARALGQLRAMDDDADLEEGEACGDDTAFVDPDVALSYIVSRLASSTVDCLRFHQFRAC
jgi:hypothetical protein